MDLNLRKEKKPKMYKLYRLSYSADRDRYIMDVDSVELQDIPDAAVHVTGEKDTYLLDATGYERPAFSAENPRANATDLNLYMLNNDINDALAVGWKGMQNMDVKKWITIGVVAIIGCCCLWAFWPTV